MPTLDNLFYEEIGNALEQRYVNRTSPHEYFFAQKYDRITAGHPFSSVLPLTDEFFGPRNLTLLIVSRPYDMEPTIIADVKTRIKLLYSQWSKYKVLVWVDMTLALQMSDAGDTDFYDKMQTLSEQLIDFCLEMQNYGFTFVEQLLEGKDANYFSTYIDPFWTE